MPATHRTDRSVETQAEGYVGYGRPGTSGVTGARAIISPRFVLARDPVGRHGRTWSRRHPDDAEGAHVDIDAGAVDTGDPAGVSAPPHERHDPG
jgi:hypothetical protein